MTTGSAGILFPSPELIRKGLTRGVFIAPYTAAAISASTLFDRTSGALLESLPSDYFELASLSTPALFIRSIATTDLDSWDADSPTRADVTSDMSTLTIGLQSANQEAIALVDRRSKMTPDHNYWRVLVLAVDETADGDVVCGRFFPRAAVAFCENVASITASVDSVLGTPEIFLFGGEGQPALQSDMGWNRSVTCTVALNTALVATTGSFYPNDVGAVVAGTIDAQA